MKQPILSRYLPPEVLRRLANVSFEPKQLVAGHLAGAHRSRASGFAVEFSGHREYVAGDDPRRIDWRVYFAREKFYVKQYDLETNLTCHLVLDTSASMRYQGASESKQRRAAQLAACLAYAILRQRDRVSLALAAEGVIRYLPPSNALDQVLRMTAELDEVAAAGGSDLPAALHDLAGRYGRREIVVVVSDLFVDLDPLEEALQRLRYFQHEVALIQVLDRDELEFEFSDTVRFIGLEDPRSLTLRAPEARTAYVAAMQKRLQRVEDLATRNACDWLLLRTDQDLGAALHAYLHRRRADRG